MDISAFKLSRHAIDRALDMGIDAGMIRECLTNPTVVVQSTAHPGFTNYRRGKITCGVANDDMTVCTVLWTHPSDWKRDLKKGAYADGRECRRNLKAGAKQ